VIEVNRTTTKIDWRKHPRQFYCRCLRCKLWMAERNKLQFVIQKGRFWQADYFEANPAFRKRYLDFHGGAQ
jgi:hypothetical protein